MGDREEVVREKGGGRKKREGWEEERNWKEGGLSKEWREGRGRDRGWKKGEGCGEKRTEGD